jgi:hypothetical protein
VSTRRVNRPERGKARDRAAICGRPLMVALSTSVGGDEETRTPDFLLAKEALYQLSYVPRWAFLDSNQRPLPYQGSALTS